MKKIILMVSFVVAILWGTSQVDMAGEFLCLMWFPILCATLIIVRIHHKFFAKPGRPEAVAEYAADTSKKRKQLGARIDATGLTDGHKQEEESCGAWSASSAISADPWERIMGSDED